jgi:hypothetical protein
MKRWGCGCVEGPGKIGLVMRLGPLGSKQILSISNEMERSRSMKIVGTNLSKNLK